MHFSSKTFVVICQGEIKVTIVSISLCIACANTMQRLADSRYPPANIAGILERFSAMFLPTCSENLGIYRDIEKHISIITSQIVALTPGTL